MQKIYISLMNTGSCSFVKIPPTNSDYPKYILMVYLSDQQVMLKGFWSKSSELNGQENNALILLGGLRIENFAVQVGQITGSSLSSPFYA